MACGWPAPSSAGMHRQKGEKNLMNDRENDTMRENEGRQVQQELEDQLRAFGDTMTDAFAASPRPKFAAFTAARPTP